MYHIFQFFPVMPFFNRFLSFLLPGGRQHTYTTCIPGISWHCKGAICCLPPVARTLDCIRLPIWSNEQWPETGVDVHTHPSKYCFIINHMIYAYAFIHKLESDSTVWNFWSSIALSWLNLNRPSGVDLESLHQGRALPIHCDNWCKSFQKAPVAAWSGFLLKTICILIIYRTFSTCFHTFLYLSLFSYVSVLIWLPNVCWQRGLGAGSSLFAPVGKDTRLLDKIHIESLLMKSQQ